MEVLLLEAGGSGKIRTATRGPHHLRGADMADAALIKLAQIARSELRSSKVMLMRPHIRVLGSGLYGIVGKVCEASTTECVAVKINTRTPLGHGNRAENAIMRLIQTVPAAAPFAIRLLSGDDRVSVTDVVEPLADGIASVTQWVRLASEADLARFLPGVVLQAAWFCAAMQAAHPTFRHNDLHGTNVLVQKSSSETRLVLDAGSDGATQFTLVAGTPRLKVIDFGLSHAAEAPNPDVVRPGPESQLPESGVTADVSRVYDLATFGTSVLRELNERKLGSILTDFRRWFDRFVGGIFFKPGNLDPEMGRLTTAALRMAEHAIDAGTGEAQAPLDLLLGPDLYWSSLAGPVVGESPIVARLDVKIKT